MHIQIYDFYVLLMNLLFKHYKMFMFIFDIFFALKFICFSYSSSSISMLTICNIYFYLFIFNLCVLCLKCISYRLTMVYRMLNFKNQF